MLKCSYVNARDLAHESVVQTWNQVFQLAKAQNVLQIFAKWELADDEWRKLGHPRETRENYNSFRVPSPANLILTWGKGEGVQFVGIMFSVWTFSPAKNA